TLRRHDEEVATLLRQGESEAALVVGATPVDVLAVRTQYARDGVPERTALRARHATAHENLGQLAGNLDVGAFSGRDDTGLGALDDPRRPADESGDEGTEQGGQGPCPEDQLVSRQGRDHLTRGDRSGEC